MMLHLSYACSTYSALVHGRDLFLNVNLKQNKNNISFKHEYESLFTVRNLHFYKLGTFKYFK